MSIHAVRNCLWVNLESCQILVHVNDLSESLQQAAPDLPWALSQSPTEDIDHLSRESREWDGQKDLERMMQSGGAAVSNWFF